MTRYNYSKLASLQNETSALSNINTDRERVKAAIDSSLSRYGDVPNAMYADLDMNGNNILNLPEPASLTEPVRLQDIQAYADGFGLVPTPTGADIGKILRVRSDTLGFDFGDVIIDTSTNNLYPDTNDGASVGITGKGFSDLFLANGAIIDFNSGNVVATHSSGVLTLTTGDLRVTTAGTNSASVVTVGGTQTLTNKTLTSPTITSPTLTVRDNAFTIQDEADNTKQLQLQLSGITTATTRTLTVPNTSDTLAVLALAQTLTNKTLALGSNTISGTTAQFNTALTDNDFATLAGSETLTNKTVNLTSNTLTGTTAQFNTALSDNDFATLAGSETLTNKTLTSPTINNGTINSAAINTPTLIVNDNGLSIRDQTDTTKIAQFECSGITTATTRTYTLPNATDTLAAIAATQTLTNKTIDLASNTLTGTLAQFNTALSGADFVSLAGSETLTNKSLTSPVVTGTADIQQAITFSGDITPAQITADQNDYAPTGFSTASTLRLSTDATRTITSLAGGTDGRLILIENVGGFNIVLEDASASGTAANRFALGASLTLTPRDGCILRYDATDSRWVKIATTGSGGGGGGAPSSAQYVVAALDATLSAERAGTDTATIAWDFGTASQAKLNVVDGSITYAKMQDISATQRLLGRNTAGAGDTEEVSAPTALSWIGNTQGQVLYRDGSAWTVLATGTAGQQLTTGGAGANVSWGGFIPVRKGADQTRTSTTTLANDSALTLSCAANTNYLVRYYIFFTSGGTPDFKYSWTGPTSPTAVSIGGFDMSTTAGTMTGINDNAFGTSHSSTGSGATTGHCTGTIVLRNGANTGTLAFQWAQNTSDPGNTTVLQGSYFEYMTF